MLEVVRGRMVPLSVAAGLCGIAAVDEEAILHLAPISAFVAANLALVNAVASWIVHVRRAVPTRADADTAAAALAQLACALGTGAIPLPLAGAIIAGDSDLPDQTTTALLEAAAAMFDADTGYRFTRALPAPD